MIVDDLSVLQVDMFSETADVDAKAAFLAYIQTVALMPVDERAVIVNELREAIHKVSPFNTEPVDFVRWVKNSEVHANDYNPNSVAPPEMELLRLSISSDGYTQPIVSMHDGATGYEVIDGFHRHRVGKECADIQSRVHGYLPLVQIRSSQQDKSDRMAATIRHNRARGEHRVDSMAEIVVELKRRFWSDAKIAKELGMESDEVLRLTQVTGLAGLFSDREFSQAWEADSFKEIEGEDVLND
jgi:ParB-like chromosome segregation protein Spo0J